LPRVHAGHVVTTYPGNLWFIDFTKVGNALRTVFVGAVTDGFSGRSPDLGALEQGQPMPHYGPREAK
jgi:hypothetical protein